MYSGLVEYANRQLLGGYASLVASLEDPELKEFARSVFLPVCWYDVLPLAELSRALAKLERLPFRDSVKRRAAFIAGRDVNGLYRVLLKVVSPRVATSRLQQTACRYFDFGVAEELDGATGYAKGRFGKLPAGLADWFGPMVEGYASVVLRMAGAGAPRVLVGPPVPDGARQGFRTVSFEIEFHWT